MHVLVWEVQVSPNRTEELKYAVVLAACEIVPPQGKLQDAGVGDGEAVGVGDGEAVGVGDGKTVDTVDTVGTVGDIVDGCSIIDEEIVAVAAAVAATDLVSSFELVVLNVVFLEQEKLRSRSRKRNMNVVDKVKFLYLRLISGLFLLLIFDMEVIVSTGL